MVNVKVTAVVVWYINAAYCESHWKSTAHVRDSDSPYDGGRRKGEMLDTSNAGD